jgi:hypothetical protein
MFVEGVEDQRIWASACAARSVAMEVASGRRRRFVFMGIQTGKRCHTNFPRRNHPKCA